MADHGAHTEFSSEVQELDDFGWDAGGDEDGYIVVPVLGGGHYALYPDGSYTEWLPAEAAQDVAA